MKAKTPVSFYEHVKVQHVLHFNDYTDQERKECWFTPSEYKQIHHGVTTAIKLINCKLFTGCARGLEKWSDGGKARKRRQLAVWAVLDEQYEQCLQAEERGEGLSYLIYDDIKFRKVSRRHTDVAVDIAYSMGRIDKLSVLGLTEKKSSRRKRSSSSSNSSKESTAKDTNMNSTLFQRTSERRLSFTPRHVQVSPSAMQA